MECCTFSSPLGEIFIAADGEAVCGAWFTGQKYDRAGLRDMVLTGPENSPALSAALAWLTEYFRGKEPKIKVKLRPEGTPFQKRVWEELLTIPFGESLSYGELAKRLGSSPRAVGSAVGRNPISLLIPCHRVLGSDGSLTGYAGGVERKKFLLEKDKNSKLLTNE